MLRFHRIRREGEPRNSYMELPTFVKGKILVCSITHMSDSNGCVMCLMVGKYQFSICILGECVCALRPTRAVKASLNQFVWFTPIAGCTKGLNSMHRSTMVVRDLQIIEQKEQWWVRQFNLIDDMLLIMRLHIRLLNMHCN